MPDTETHLNSSEVTEFINKFKYSTSSTQGSKLGLDVKRQFLAHYVMIEEGTTTTRASTDEEKNLIIDSKTTYTKTEKNGEVTTTTTITKTGDNYTTTINVAPTYELLGYKVESSSIEFNWDSEPITDITGSTYNSIKKSEPKMTLDGYIINTKSNFLDKLSKKAIRNAYTEFNNETLVTVYYWLSANDKSNPEKEVYLAKQETNCSIIPTSIGGEGTLVITPEITFSNKSVFGYVTDKITETSPNSITFTEAKTVNDVTART